MKAKKVYEFKQGGNPYDTMGVGSNRPFKEGDKIQLIKPIWWQDRDVDNSKYYHSGTFESNSILDYVYSKRHGYQFLPGEILTCTLEKFEGEQIETYWDSPDGNYIKDDWIQDNKDHWKRL
jgi:hypothetical protein